MSWDYDEAKGKWVIDEPPDNDGGYFRCRGTDRYCAGSWYICKHGNKVSTCECGCSYEPCEECEAEEEKGEEAEEDES